jgi:hypothetical protein
MMDRAYEAGQMKICGAKTGMPWKIRNGRPYYYQSVRDGGRVRSKYAGAGKVAVAAAGNAESDRRRRAEAEALESAGFHKHKRGEWRRKRTGDEADALPIEVPEPRPPLPHKTEVIDVLERAEVGDEVAMGRLRDMLRSDLSGMMNVCGDLLASREWLACVGRMGVRPPRDDREADDKQGGDPMVAGEIVPAMPTGPELEKLAEKARRGDNGALAEIRRALAGRAERLIQLGSGDLARGVESLAIASLAGEDQLFRDGVRAKMDLLRAELGGPQPSPIERLLAERAALCWLDCHGADLVAEVEGRKGMDAKARDYHDRRRERAHRRYLSALKTLAQIRKLALPAIQVNIGGQQVNVAGS